MVISFGLYVPFAPKGIAIKCSKTINHSILRPTRKWIIAISFYAYLVHN